MNYRLIPYFLKIAECKSLSAASGELGISVSTLSRYLSRTEDQVGQTLFMRKNQKLELTEAGKLLYRRASQLLDLAERKALGHRRLRDIPFFTDTARRLWNEKLDLCETYYTRLAAQMRTTLAWDPTPEHL